MSYPTINKDYYYYYYYNFSIDSSAIEKGYVQNTPCLSHPAESTPESCSVKIWSMKSLRGENCFKFLPPRQNYII